MSPDTTTPAKSLVTKLSEIMKEVGRIPKKGRNTFHNYDYVKEADLVEKLSDLLAERHIFITSSKKGIEVVELSKVVPKTGEVIVTKMGILTVEYTFHDGDSGEKLTMDGAGEIDQDGGKGLYKALTGSMKYFLMKNFLVATGDDPERDEPKQSPSRPAKAQKDAAPPPPPAPPKPVKQSTLDAIETLAKKLGGDPQKLWDKYSKGNPPEFEDQAMQIMKALLEREKTAKPVSEVDVGIDEVSSDAGKVLPAAA